MGYKSPSELNFVACSTISVFEQVRPQRYIANICSFVFLFFRTRTPPIRVTYFLAFVNRFLKNIFEKIL